MSNVNKIILIGRVGQDPEVNETKGAKKYAKFSMATSESYKKADGEKVEDTQWHNLIVWEGLAGVVEQYVKKGDLLYICGKMTYREHDGKWYSTVVAKELTMLGSKGGQQSSPTEEDDEEDDLPF